MAAAVSKEEIAALVGQAVATEAAKGPTPLTAADVQRIVDASTAVAIEVAREQASAAQVLAMATVGLNVVPDLFQPRPVTTNLDSDQTLVFPFNGRRSHTTPWREGGYSGRVGLKFYYMPLFDSDDQGGLRRGVALSYEVSEDLTTYTVHMDPDAVFINGDPVTAADVKLAWEWSAIPEHQAAWGASILHLDKVKGFKGVSSGDVTEASGLVALDDNTLQVTLDSPNPTWALEMGIWLLGIYDAEYAYEQ